MHVPTDVKRTAPSPRRRELTGRTVLLSLVAFFGVVAAANGALVHFALSTFAGVETGNAYKLGLAFQREIAAARTQDTLGWRIDASLRRAASNRTLIDVDAADAAGAPLVGKVLAALLKHPADSRLDHAVELTETARGHYAGVAIATAGQWDLLIDIVEGSERLYRSTSRVTLH